uniref:Nudix hydrolase domain-containing protein n=1 Tax=Entomoneis paludosa TaxID=265537 RepID=A0A7S2VB88_9STRA|mmetsp:Transcript_1444/g.3109  ORF Transcript_1444/g.3109 Transcript_1444/m.3109 type:complete len:230 (+) Transcript_1444:89-778(+)
MSSSPSWMIPAAFAAGVATTFLVQSLTSSPTNDRENAGAVVEGNDLSLFYGDETQLTEITNARKFLPKDLYGSLVRDAVVCCLDILLVRTNENGVKEALLVERSTEPAKGLWWLPGGRLLKGETFFAAAKRKAEQETGLSNVRPIQVLGVWNTFFPLSHWDTKESQGTQTVNPIVLVELEGSGEIKLDNTSENFKWVSLDPKDNKDADRYVMQALLRLKAWDPNYIKYS